MLLWIQGFAESYFDDMFEFLMRSDPVLGNGSWGQTARLAVERCYVMHDILKEQASICALLEGTGKGSKCR